MMYGVYHLFDVDGGFGDAIYQEELLFITPSEEFATKYKEKWSKKHVYDVPYSALTRGELDVRALLTVDGEDRELNLSPVDICGEDDCAWAPNIPEFSRRCFNCGLRSSCEHKKRNVWAITCEDWKSYEEVLGENAV